MYISRIQIKNFRNIKSEVICFNEGVNVIIGHNNSGKTNLLKALSLVIDTESSKRLDVDDFHKNVTLADLKANSPKIEIAVTLKKGAIEHEDDLSMVGNWLTKLQDDYEATLTYEFFLPEKDEQNYQKELAQIQNEDPKAMKKAWKVIKHDFIRLYTYRIWGGNVVNQTQADSESLQKFDYQFLDAIRDVERDMLTGRNTLLRDVLDFFMDYKIKADPDKSNEQKSLEIKQKKTEFSEKAEELIDLLQSRMKEGKNEILSYAKETGASFNKAEPDFEGSISEIELFSALKLIVKHETGITVPATHNGLGYNNLIYMSLLLAKMQVNSDGGYMGSNAKVFAALAIEEPEAHLHPAMQFKFLKFLKENKEKRKVRQVFVTTHSTHITSAVSLDEIICLHNEGDQTSIGYPKNVFPNEKYKKYVQRFLDATKSDMLFAQKVILVEGLAEQLLLSVFAKYYNIQCEKEFELQQIEEPNDDVYISKTLEDNHVAVINVGGRFFDHFLHLFDKNKEGTIHKKVACLTDRDPTRKLKTDSKFKKCYPFEFKQDDANYDYQDNPTVSLTTYNTHPNIRFFSQDELKGKTFEYDLVTYNPTLKLLVTESMSNRTEILELMDIISDEEKDVSHLIDILPLGSTENPNKQNVEIKTGIESCNWHEDNDKKTAIVASRYLNSVGKGENALELAYALEANLEKIGTAAYVEFTVPKYIQDAIDWICQ